MNAYITGNHELFVRSFDEWLEVGTIKRERNRFNETAFILMYDGYDDIERVYLGATYPTAEHAAEAFRDYQRGG